MITDYRGVAANGELAICYGDHGIITITRDEGRTWSRVFLGDKYDIKKIVSIGKDLIGASGCSLLKYNAGKDRWINKDVFGVPEIISVTTRDSLMYVLTKSGVLVADFNLNIDTENFISLDTNSTYSEIVTDNSCFYIIANDSLILRYWNKNPTPDILDLAKLYPKENRKCISNLKIHNGKLHCIIEGQPLINKDMRTVSYTFNTLVSSSDHGSTWQKLTDSLHGSSYNIINGELIEVYSSANYIEKALIPYCYKFDAAGKRVLQNNADTDGRYFTYCYNFGASRANYLIDSKLALKDVIRTDSGTLLAAGDQMQIIVSTDGGASWEFKSLFFSYNNQSSPIDMHFLGDSIICAPNYRTTNAGTTWLPPRRGQKLEEGISMFNNDGSGIICPYQNSGDTSLKYYYETKDFGDTWEIIAGKTNHVKMLSSLQLNYGSEHLIACFCYEPAGKAGMSRFTGSSLYSVGKDFKFTDLVHLDSTEFRHLQKYGDTGVYAIAEQWYSFNHQKNYYDSCRFVIIKSEDRGMTWAEVKPLPPFTSILAENKYTYLSFGGFQDYMIARTGILIDNTCREKFFCYDIHTNSFDTIPNGFLGLNFNKCSLFPYEGKIYIPAKQSLYFNSESLGNPAEWDSLSYSDILPGWRTPASYQFQNIGDDQCIDTKYDGKNSYLIMGTFSDYELNGLPASMKVNIVRLRPPMTETSIEESTPLAGRGGYITNTPPCPVPAKDIVTTTIHTCPALDAESAEINVYDVNGTRVNAERIIPEQTGSSSAIISFDCSKLPNGLYMMRISAAGAIKCVPIVVVR